MGTVGKAMTVLEAFTPEQPEIGLSDLARRLKFDKATTLRLLSSMQAHGMVEKYGPSKLYRLGPAVQRLAHIRAETLTFAEVAQPILDRLRDDTGESCHISEASRTQLSTVLVAHSAKALRINFTIGEDVPFHCTASGVAYLAFAQEEVLERVARGPLPKITQYSKTKPAELRAQVIEARSRGYAINNGEFDAEAISVAAPIFDTEELAFASISVATPQSRMDAKHLARYGTLVVRAAREITAALGGKTVERKQ